MNENEKTIIANEECLEGSHIRCLSVVPVELEELLAEIESESDDLYKEN